MRTLKLVLIILSLSFCLPGQGQNARPEQIKIISYNIWNGLAAEYGHPYVTILKEEGYPVSLVMELPEK